MELLHIFWIQIKRKYIYVCVCISVNKSNVYPLHECCMMLAHCNSQFRMVRGIWMSCSSPHAHTLPLTFWLAAIYNK